jgi:hypothetical protein
MSAVQEEDAAMNERPLQLREIVNEATARAIENTMSTPASRAKEQAMTTNEPTQASAPTDKSDADEWVLVPRKPTGAMKKAAFGPILHGGRNGPLTADFLRQEAAISTYRAMLAAAPPAPTQAGDSMTHADWLRACTAWLDDPQMRPSVLDHMNLAAEALTAASQREAALRTALEEAQAKIRDCGDVIRWLVRGVDFERSAPNGMRPTIRAALATNPGERP